MPVLSIPVMTVCNIKNKRKEEEERERERINTRTATVIAETCADVKVEFVNCVIRIYTLHASLSFVKRKGCYSSNFISLHVILQVYWLTKQHFVSLKFT